MLNRPPAIVSPYDAELFGHWWFEGPRFLDYFVRKATFDQTTLGLATPEEYLRRNPVQQVAEPAPSSWGEGGYWSMWLNEDNEWIYRHLILAQERMTELARKPGSAGRSANRPLEDRALRQAARELLLAQSSDWGFIVRTGTSPGYARSRIENPPFQVWPALQANHHRQRGLSMAGGCRAGGQSVLGCKCKLLVQLSLFGSAPVGTRRASA